MLLVLLAGGIMVGSMVTAIVKSWQITKIEEALNDPFNPYPPDHVPARKPYWIAAAALNGVGILGTIALTFYRTDKTTSVQRADMVREHNDVLKKGLDLAASRSPSTAQAVGLRIALRPIIDVYGGGLALCIQY